MGALARIRANPWLAVGSAVAALLIAAWLGWSIYVASDRGVNEGLGALIALPAIALALALISLPFIGVYLLIKRLSSDSGDTGETDDEAHEDAQQEEETEGDAEPETAAG